MSGRLKKLAAKKAAYEEAMRQQPAAAQNRQQTLSQNRKRSADRWICHEWSDVWDKVMTRALPACFADPGNAWHREGTIDEIEAKENAGQRSLF